MDRYLQFSANSIAKVVFLNHLLECKKCHIQYLGKAEGNFNLKLTITAKIYINQMLIQLYAICSERPYLLQRRKFCYNRANL